MADVGVGPGPHDRPAGPEHRPWRGDPPQAGPRHRRPRHRGPAHVLRHRQRHHHRSRRLPGRSVEPDADDRPHGRGLVGDHGADGGGPQLSDAAGNPFRARVRPGHHRTVCGQPGRRLLPGDAAGAGVLGPAVPAVRRFRARGRPRRRCGRHPGMAGGLPHRGDARDRHRRGRLPTAGADPGCRRPHAPRPRRRGG